MLLRTLPKLRILLIELRSVIERLRRDNFELFKCGISEILLRVPCVPWHGRPPIWLSSLLLNSFGFLSVHRRLFSVKCLTGPLPSDTCTLRIHPSNSTLVMSFRAVLVISCNYFLNDFPNLISLTLRFWVINLQRLRRFLLLLHLLSGLIWILVLIVEHINVPNRSWELVRVSRSTLHFLQLLLLISLGILPFFFSIIVVFALHLWSSPNNGWKRKRYLLEGLEGTSSYTSS